MAESSAFIRLRLLGAAATAGDLRRVDAALRTLNGDATRAAGGLRNMSTASSKAERSMAKVREKSVAAAAAVAKVAGVSALAASGGLLAATKAGAEFEQVMANVQGKLLTGSRNMQLLSAQALKLGGSTSYSATQVAGSMEELAAQGFSTRKIMQTIPGTLSLAAASGADLAQAAALQTETLHAFNLSAGKAGMVADVLAQASNKTAADIDTLQESLKYISPVAKSFGISFQNAAAATGLLANVGIKGAQAGTTLRTMMVRLTAPTAKARSAMADLGLRAGDLAGPKGLLSLPNIMEKFAKGTRSVSVAQRNAALAAIFGREALSGSLRLVALGPQKLKSLSDALTNSAGAAKRAADIQRHTVKGAFDQLTGSVETASIKLTRRFNPAIRSVLMGTAANITTATSAVQGFMNGFAAGPATGSRSAPSRVDGMGNRVRRPQIAGGARGVGQQARQIAGQVQQGAGQAIAFLQANVLPGVVDVAKQVIAALRPAMPFLEGLIPLARGIGEGVLSGIVGTFQVAIPVITVVSRVLGWLGTNVLKPMAPVLLLVGRLIGFFAGPAVLGKVAKVLTVVLGKGSIVTRVVVGLADKMKALGKGAEWVIKNFTKILTPFRQVVGLGRNITWIFGAGMRAALGRLPGVAGRAALKMLKALTWPHRQIIKLGARVVTGIADGLKSAPQALLDAGKWVGQKIVDGVIKLIKSAPGAVASAVSSIVPGPLKDAVGLGGGLLKKVTGRATGGMIRPGEVTLVGERGPELIHRPGMMVMPAAQTRYALNGRPGRLSPAASRAIDNHVHVYLDNREVHASTQRRELLLQEMA